MTTLRTTYLNPDLGISDDSGTEPWGSATVRDLALRLAVRRLWPRMARLVREDIDIVAGQVDYELEVIWDLETIEVLNSDGRVYKELRNWRNWVDFTESVDDDLVRRILLPVHWTSGTTDTIRAIGYAPYTIIEDPET